MIDTIRRDFRQFPHLFFWNGPIPKPRLDNWLSREQLAVPEDLIELWEEFGGGDFFDSETILSPFGDIVLGDDVTGATEFHRGKGLPPGYLLFHKGVSLSAVRLSDQRYVTFSRSHALLKEFSTLEEWYNDLRSEFSEVYGL